MARNRALHHPRIRLRACRNIDTERSKAFTGYPDTCGNRFRAELRGALEYAAWTFIQRDAKVTHYAT